MLQGAALASCQAENEKTCDCVNAEQGVIASAGGMTRGGANVVTNSGRDAAVSHWGERRRLFASLATLLALTWSAAAKKPL